jgi:hypothetical protein
MGDAAGQAPGEPNTTTATNLANQSTILMRDTYGMVFTAESTINDIATYTHGMIQAIYKAYGLGPSCTPYEIAVGDHTKRWPRVFPARCSWWPRDTRRPRFISVEASRGFPSTNPYNPGGRAEANEVGVIRDLNNAWYDACAKFLTVGLHILDDDHTAGDHQASRDAVRSYLTSNKGKTVAGTLVLDAVTVHDGETERINRTLR